MMHLNSLKKHFHRSLLVSVLPIAVAASFVVAPAHAQSSDTAQTGKPNIVLINMDNFGYGELGVYGGGILRGGATPRIDKLATEGMRLLNYNVEAQCTPSRAALLTGRYAIRTGNGSVPLANRQLWFDPVGIHHA